MNGITERKLWVTYITFVYSIYSNANGFTEDGGWEGGGTGGGGGE